MSDVLNVPRPSWMSEDLVLLEEQARRFLATELVPHVERWTEDGIMAREAWNKLGEAGLLCAGIPEEYGGAGGTLRARDADQSRVRAGRARSDRRAAAFRHRRALHPALRHRGAEAALAAEARDRRDGRRHRDERARHRLRPAGREDEREEIRQRLCAQRLEDLHHQRPARQPDHRRRQDRSERGPQGHLADGGRDRRRARLPARPQAQQARDGLGGHVGTVFRGREAPGRRLCWGRRKGRVSSN